MNTFKQIVKKSSLYQPLNLLRTDLRRWNRIRQWQRLGCPIPPPAEVKHATINEYRKRFRLDVLIETGTYFGDTIAATKNYFSDVYSIELSPKLHQGAKARFGCDPNVHLLLGDSGTVLKEILPTIPRIPLFWLDAHYSDSSTARGAVDTPIVQELEIIFASCQQCVVLIDDARCFDGHNGYPTLAELEKYAAGKALGWEFEVKYDIIRLHGKSHCRDWTAHSTAR
jgi:hypothetical protein